MRKLLLILVLGLGLAAAGAAIYWQRANAVMRAPGPHTQALEMVVKAGDRVSAVIVEIEKRGAITD